MADICLKVSAKEEAPVPALMVAKRRQRDSGHRERTPGAIFVPNMTKVVKVHPYSPSYLEVMYSETQHLSITPYPGRPGLSAKEEAPVSVSCRVGDTPGLTVPYPMLVPGAYHSVVEASSLSSPSGAGGCCSLIPYSGLQ